MDGVANGHSKRDVNDHVKATGKAPSWDEGVPIGNAADPQAEQKVEDAPPWESRWVTYDAATIVAAPPERKFLLHAGGRPCLPACEVGTFVAPGGIGKTNSIVQVGAGIASGTAIFDGALQPVQQGAVLLALGEEKPDEVQRRMHNASKIVPASPTSWAHNIVSFGLSGMPTALLQGDGHGNQVETPFCRWFLEKLASRDDWKLIVLDSLSRFAGPEAESSNAGAAVFISLCERIAQRANATVLVVHHSSKAARAAGDYGATASRGASALSDNVRFQWTLKPEAHEFDDPDLDLRLGETVSLANVKNNYARRSELIELRRDPHLHGLFRGLDSADRQYLSDHGELARCRAAVLTLVQQSPGIGSKKLRESRCGFSGQKINKARDSLASDGTIVNRGTDGDHAWFISSERETL